MEPKRSTSPDSIDACGRTRPEHSTGYAPGYRSPVWLDTNAVECDWPAFPGYIHHNQPLRPAHRYCSACGYASYWAGKGWFVCSRCGESKPILEGTPIDSEDH